MVINAIMGDKFDWYHICSLTRQINPFSYLYELEYKCYIITIPMLNVGLISKTLNSNLRDVNKGKG